MTGAIPVPVATSRRSRSGTSRKTNVPAGPLNCTASPGCRAYRNDEPGPSGTRLKRSVTDERRLGGDAMEYARVSGRGRSETGILNDTNCPP